MGSRYCETDKLSQTAWDLFGKIPSGWGRVQAVCDFVHRHIKFDYMRARSTRTAFEAFNERTGVCRDALPVPQHSGSLRQRPSWRHWRSCGRSDGFQRLDRGVPRRVVVDIRSSQQCPTDRQNRYRARPGRGGYPLINSSGPHVLKSFRVGPTRSSNCQRARSTSSENATPSDFRQETLWAQSVRIVRSCRPLSKTQALRTSLMGFSSDLRCGPAYSNKRTVASEDQIARGCLGWAAFPIRAQAARNHRAPLR
jgi:hypothetical protein